MSDVLDEAYNIVRCKECSWYRSCVMPMRFSVEDLQRQLGTGTPVPGMPPLDASVQSFLSGMAIAAQNLLLEACPIFVDRLRVSPKLAARIKQLMRGWASGEDGEEKSR